MKLFFSAPSPFVRKVMIAAFETGQAERIEKLPAAAHPVNRDPNIVAINPSGKVPTAITDEGLALYDSRVICRYLDSRHDGHKLYPDGAELWPVLTLEALADGLLEAAVLARYENAVRPQELRWEDWLNGLTAKIDSSLDVLAKRLEEFDGRLHAGGIAAACALGYLDFRFGERDWRDGRERLADWFRRVCERESMRLTAPE